MNRATLFALVFGWLAVGTGSAAFAAADDAATQCSVSTLDGSYVYSTQGTLDGEPYASAGIMSFDGEGKVAILATRSMERKQITISGTYTIESNCSGSMKVSDGTINHLYLGPAGKSFNFVRVTGKGAVGGKGKRVSRGSVGESRGR